MENKTFCIQLHHTYHNNSVDEGVIGMQDEAQAGRHVHDVGVEPPIEEWEWGMMTEVVG